MKQSCPCGLAESYENCCLRIHSDLKVATTAEKLMRARYTAFAVQNIDFLVHTYHPSTRGEQEPEAIAQWAAENRWIGLEIIHATANTVEFKAHFLDASMQAHTHHERSTFKEFEGCWYFVDGLLVS